MRDLKAAQSELGRSLIATRPARWSVSLVALAAATLPSVAVAQTSTPTVAAAITQAPPTATPESVDTQPTGGDIVVTARRRDERLQDVPAAITAVTGETLQRYNIQTLTDVAKQVPQLVVGRATSGAGATITLRGVGTPSLSNGFSQSVAINIDSIQIPRGNAVAIGYLDMSGIEVLRGPQALFFGKNSSAGVISINTNNPTEHFEASLKTGYEFEARNVYGEGVISGPVTDRFRLRLAVRGSNEEGYFYNRAAAFNDPRGFINPGAANNRYGPTSDLAGRLSAAWDAADGLEVLGKVFLSRFRGVPAEAQSWRCQGPGGGASPVFGITDTAEDCRINRTLTATAVPDRIASGLSPAQSATDGYFNLDTTLASLNVNYTSGKIHVQSITGYYDTDQHDLTSRFGGAIFANGRSQYRAFTEELRVSTDLEGPINFTTAALYEKSRYTVSLNPNFQNIGGDAATGSLLTLRSLSNTRGEAYSVMGEAVWKIIPTVELDAGVRYTNETKDLDQVNTYVNSRVAAAFPLNRPFFANFKDDNFSPQASLTWKPNRDLTLYGGYRSGYKSGGFNTSAFVTFATTPAAVTFGSETGSGFEAGIKSRLLDRRLTLNANVYTTDFDNLQTLVFNGTTFSFVAGNAGKLRSRGAELELKYNFGGNLNGFETHANLGYNDSKYINYIGQCFTGQTVVEGCNLNRNAAGSFTSQNFAGSRPPRAPTFAGNAGFSVEQPLFDEVTFQLSGDLNYTGRYQTHDANRPDAFQNAFATVDGSIGLASRTAGWQLSLIGRNLTNKYVVLGANDQSIAGGGTGTAVGIRPDITATVSRGRTVTIQLSKRF